MSLSVGHDTKPAPSIAPWTKRKGKTDGCYSVWSPGPIPRSPRTRALCSPMSSILSVVRCTLGPPTTFLTATMVALRGCSIPNTGGLKSTENRLWFANAALKRATIKPLGSPQRKRLFRAIRALPRSCTSIAKIPCIGGPTRRFRIGRSRQRFSTCNQFPYPARRSLPTHESEDGGAKLVAFSSGKSGLWADNRLTEGLLALPQIPADSSLGSNRGHCQAGRCRQ
jgi:hypothetical protein